MARPARRPADEDQRIAKLRGLSVLDTEAEPLFDALTRAAALVAGVPIALVSLIDTERQWFKANHGLEGTSETSRDVAFCAHAILSDSILEVNDARLDERFADNPLVTGGPGIRFYAGAPIVLHDGVRVGSLCVIDREPRVLSIDQRRVLTALAKVASEALEQRALGFERNAALQREADAGAKLAQIVKATDAATSEWNVQTGEVRCNARWAQLMGKTAAAAAHRLRGAVAGGRASRRPGAAAVAAGASSARRTVRVRRGNPHQPPGRTLDLGARPRPRHLAAAIATRRSGCMARAWISMRASGRNWRWPPARRVPARCTKPRRR